MYEADDPYAGFERKSDDPYAGFERASDDPSTLDIVDGKLTRTHPSKMTDDEIATRILGIKKEDWLKAKSSGQYKLLSRGGKKQVLADAFTDPDGWWGSYVVGKNKDTPGASANRAVQNLFAGANRVKLAGDQFFGSLLDSVGYRKNPGAAILEDALLRANQANQNINEGRQPGRGGTDWMNMAGQAVMASAMGPKGVPGVNPGNLGARLIRNTPINFALGGITTPGTPQERLAAATTAAAAGNVLEGGSAAVTAAAQKLFGVTKGEKATAARRQAALDKLNAKHGSNLELTAGQLSGNQRMIGLESLSENVPFGMAKARRAGSDELVKIMESRVAQSAEALKNTGYRDIGDLADAVSRGDKNAARILRDIVDPAGDTASKVVGASREVNLWPLKQRNNALWEMFKTEGDAIGPISMAGEVERLNPLIADLENVLGPNAGGVGTAKSVANDIAKAQREIFPKPVPDSVYSGFQPSYPQGGVGELVSGSTGAQTLNTVPGSVSEFLQGVYPRVKSTGRVFPQSAPETMGLAIPEVTDRLVRPPSTSKALNAGNIHESISRLKAAADAVRNSDPRLAGELDQIVTGMDTRLEQAASQNPTVRGALDAAKLDTKEVLRPVQNADTALSIPGPNGESISIPQSIALEDRGLAAVRNLAEENALRKGFARGRKGRGYIDSDVAATQLENPALQQFYPDQAGADLGELTDILRASAENGQYMTNPKTGARLAPFEVMKMLLAGAGGALAYSNPLMAAKSIAGGLTLGPAARGLFNTKVGRELLLGNQFNPLISGEAARMMSMPAAQLWGGSNPEETVEY